MTAFTEDSYMHGEERGAAYFNGVIQHSSNLNELYAAVMDCDRLAAWSNAHGFVSETDEMDDFVSGWKQGFVGMANEWARAYYYEMEG